MSPSATTHLQPWKSFSVNTLCSFVAFYVIIKCTANFEMIFQFSRFFVFGNKVIDIWRALRMLRLSNGVCMAKIADQKVCCGRSVVVLQPTTHRFHPWAQNAIIVLAGFLLLTGLFRRISSYNRSNTIIIVAYSWVRLTDRGTYSRY